MNNPANSSALAAGSLLAIIGGTAAAGASLLPYTHDIHLLDCHVAGTSHLELEDIELGLLPGHALELHREPGNSHDPLAILVLDRRGAKLGYIPRAKNEVLARLMDAGKLLQAQVAAKQWVGAWLKIEIHISLREW